MRQMTIRDIPDDVEAIIRSEAAQRCVSLNKAFLSLLIRGAQHTSVPSQHNKVSYARFRGVWSEEEAKLFDDELDNQRMIDSELWS